MQSRGISRMPQQLLTPLDLGRNSIQHDGLPPVAHKGGSSDDGAAHTAGTTVSAGGENGLAWKHHRASTQNHCSHNKNNPQPAPPSLTDMAPAHRITSRNQQGDLTTNVKQIVFGGLIMHSDTAPGCGEEHVVAAIKTTHVPVWNTTIEAPPLATMATPLLDSTQRSEGKGAHIHPSAIATSPTSNVQTIIGAVRRPTAQSNVPSRRSSMTRLREQVKAHREAVGSCQCTNESNATSSCSANAAVQALQSVAAQGQGGKEKHRRLRSFQRASPGAASASSPSPSPAEAISRTDSGIVVGPLAAPGKISAGAEKILPNGLRSPSAITDFSAALLDASGLESVQKDLLKLADPVPYHDRQPSLCDTSSVSGKPSPRYAPRSRAGGALLTSAPFHALRLASLSPEDSVVSSVLSSSVIDPHDLDNLGHVDEIKFDREESMYANGPLATGEEADPQSLLLGVVPALTTNTATGSRSRISRPTVAGHEAPRQVGRQFVLVGSCTEGRHTCADLYKVPAVHHYLTKVTKHVRRIEKRQDSLEGLLLCLHQQLNSQAAALRQVTKEMLRVRQSTTTSPGLQGSPTESFANSNFERALTLSSGHKAKKCPTHRKALPRDVSAHEPLVADYGIFDEHGAGDGAVGGYKKHVRLYARQLEKCTSSGLQYLDMVDARSRRIPPRTTVQPEEQFLGNGGTSTALQKLAQAGSQGRCENMPQSGAFEQRQQCGTHCGECGASGSVAQYHAHCNGGDGISLVPSGIRAGGSVSPAGHAVSAGGPDVQYSHFSRHQPGAGGSTEVSGMSNVPHYQPPNVSVSPIKSPSVELDDPEEDTDTGFVRQQLFHLSPMERPMDQRGDKGNDMSCSGEASVHTKRQEDPPLSLGVSFRSAPSLKSVTYAPSEFAHVQAGASGGAVPCSGPVTPVLSISVMGTQSRPAKTNYTAAPLGADGGLPAAPLKRLTLLRTSAVIPGSPARCTGADLSSCARPAAIPPLLTPVACAPTASAASVVRGVLSVEPPRGISVPLAKMGLSSPSSSLMVQVPLPGKAAGRRHVLKCSRVGASFERTSLAMPLLESVKKQHAVSKRHQMRAHSCLVDSDCTERHSSESPCAVDRDPRKGEGRRSSSKTPHDARANRRSNAQGARAVHESADQGVAVRHLSSPSPKARVSSATEFPSTLYTKGLSDSK